jgi:hypothetical protein
MEKGGKGGEGIGISANMCGRVYIALSFGDSVSVTGAVSALFIPLPLPLAASHPQCRSIQSSVHTATLLN